MVSRLKLSLSCRCIKSRDKFITSDITLIFITKCNNLARCVKNHGHLLDLMSQMTCCNGEEFCGSTLCLVKTSVLIT